MVGRKFDTSWRTVAQLNSLNDPYTLYTGQKLCISGKLIPVKETISTPLGGVRVYATKVIEDKSVQLQGVRLMARTPYVVYLSKFSSLNPVRYRAGLITTDASGQFNQIFNLPYFLKDIVRIRVEVDNGWNDRTENWFINANNQANTGGYGAPAIRLSLVSVVQDTSISVKARNVPGNVTYLVYIGKPGARLEQMERVGTMRTGKAGTVTAEYAIPAEFAQQAKLEIHLVNKPLGVDTKLTFKNQ